MNPESPIDRRTAVRVAFAEAFNLTASEVDGLPAETSAGDLPGWDSQGHVRLMLALERVVGRQFSDDEVLEMTSLDAILRVVGAANV